MKANSNTRKCISLKEIKDPVLRLKKLYELSMNVAGDPIEVFKHVAGMIGEVFDVRVVCLSEIRNDELYFISVYVDGDIMIDVDHCPLNITPCATVEKSKDIRIYDEVIDRFPNASFLKTHNAFSYCGFPSLGSEGEVLAVTCLLDDKPHDFSEEDQDLLRILGQRIAFEIERNRHLADQKEAAEKVRKLAYYDSLTQLPNRTLFLDRLQQAIVQAERHNHLGAVLYVDLDRFKNINDSLGHSIGDNLLRELAIRLNKCVRTEDTVARLGGDEFVVLLSNVAIDRAHAASHARIVAEKIFKELTKSYIIEEHELQVSPSIGIALYPDGVNTTDDVLKHADTAMYRAKAVSSEPIQFFQKSMQDAVLERLIMEKNLRYAIDRNELMLHYQPIVELANNQVIGAEALLRWQHPEHGMIPPDQFIPVAEETGQILSIGDWVLQQAVSQYDAWEKSGLDIKNIFLAVNISPRQFHQADFVENIMKIIKHSTFRPSNLKIEITENIVMSNIDDAVIKIQKLKSHGITFSVDDFGTGHSSLAYLKRLPLDVLKIDKSFVQDVAIDKDSRAIVESIIAMAKHLELDVVAEGVESKEQYDFLKERGCGCYQGYYFSRPVPAETFAQYF